ncbi:unnamed protein product [Symbiodinium necroappetens]|uniref:Uncharacterized protein n=1 Tax=Symbiodinium necroappetens TaxID=1628268 RepID=A0A813A2K6_9DINO|nr:unnamed protein product [Symbiodinium necroappetens]
MGCSQSSGCIEASRQHSFKGLAKHDDIKSALQVRDKVMVECEEPSLMKDFDSWRHVMDEDDMKALESGKSLPINRTAHQQISQQTRSALKKLVDDPEALQRLVKKHRMAGNDDISAFVIHGATNLGDSAVVLQSMSCAGVVSGT